MKTLLFDLGGVVVDYRGPERLSALSKGVLSLEEAREALSSSSFLHEFERGEISPESFAEKAVADWRLDVAPDVFIADFEVWPERLFPGAKAAIDGMRGRFRLACLSNINIPHWRQAETLGLGGFFEHDFLSHEMGARKPEEQIYEQVFDALDVPPQEIIFFDDVAANINMANAMGMETRHIETPDRLLSALQSIKETHKA